MIFLCGTTQLLYVVADQWYHWGKQFFPGILCWNYQGTYRVIETNEEKKIFLCGTISVDQYQLNVGNFFLSFFGSLELRIAKVPCEKLKKIRQLAWYRLELNNKFSNRSKQVICRQTT